MTEKAAAYGIADAVLTATSGIETMSSIMLWLAIVFLAIGMARSAVTPTWLGWVVVIPGIAMVAIVGVSKFFMGYTSTLLILFGDLAPLTTVWLLVLGFWVARKAWQRTTRLGQIKVIYSLYPKPAKWRNQYENPKISLRDLIQPLPRPV